MFYTTHRSAGGKRGRRTAMTSSHRAVTRRVQILVSVTLCCECSPGSPCMPCLEQPCPGAAGACTVLWAINVLLHGLLGSDLSLPLTWQELGCQHQHLHRDRTGDPGNLTWDWAGGTTSRKLSTNCVHQDLCS